MDLYSLASAAFASGLAAILDYVAAHTLFCLVPAFFIAGAMAALVPKHAFLRYLGKNSPKSVAYPIAIVSGLLLAVCSCTVLPLFAGIRKSGAGLGPAIAFLYTAPATNIVAILYTGSLIGWDIAAARIFFSVLFALAIGLTLGSLFKEEKDASAPDLAKQAAQQNKAKRIKHEKKRLLFLFATLVAILLVGTRVSEEMLRYGLTAALIGVTAFITKKYFSREEFNAWMSETLSFAKKIFPLLLAGVFASGIIRALLPGDWVSSLVGSNSITAMIIPVVFGIVVYFPTLVEVPMAKTFLELGMSKSALLAYLLADPVVSLPSLLVLREIMGAKKTLVYAALILVLTVSAGLLFGALTA
ncbi:MAG: permease [Candidatus Micrarchaeota archaeon]